MKSPFDFQVLSFDFQPLTFDFHSTPFDFQTLPFDFHPLLTIFHYKLYHFKAVGVRHRKKEPKKRAPQSPLHFLYILSNRTFHFKLD
jgi:hypothetical protein